jgi:hypothetical protein
MMGGVHCNLETFPWPYAHGMRKRKMVQGLVLHDLPFLLMISLYSSVCLFQVRYLVYVAHIIIEYT